jgi:small subunit ribosomal protein S1
LILSERAAVRQWRESQKDRLLEGLRVGEVRRGVVSSLADFGAFVDLGGADGLVHLSEISWNRSTKPSDVLKVGQEIDVYVLNVDQKRKRIALSIKRLEPEPWTSVEDRYYIGQLVEGQITRLANFGAFALVNGEVEGLIHISELSLGRINHPQEVVQEGETHVMRIIRIDASRRRMGLSLKRVADPAYVDLDWRAELEESQALYEHEEDAPTEEDALTEEDDNLVYEVESDSGEDNDDLVDEAEAGPEDEDDILVDEVEAGPGDEEDVLVDEVGDGPEDEDDIPVDQAEDTLSGENDILVDDEE